MMIFEVNFQTSLMFLATKLSPATIGKLYRNQVSRFDENTVKSLCVYFKLKSLSNLLEIEWETDNGDSDD
jgi:hypothetical protein